MKPLAAIFDFDAIRAGLAKLEKRDEVPPGDYVGTVVGVDMGADEKSVTITADFRPADAAREFVAFKSDFRIQGHETEWEHAKKWFSRPDERMRGLYPTPKYRTMDEHASWPTPDQLAESMGARREFPSDRDFELYHRPPGEVRDLQTKDPVTWTHREALLWAEVISARTNVRRGYRLVHRARSSVFDRD